MARLYQRQEEKSSNSAFLITHASRLATETTTALEGMDVSRFHHAPLPLPFLPSHPPTSIFLGFRKRFHTSTAIVEALRIASAASTTVIGRTSKLLREISFVPHPFYGVWGDLQLHSPGIQPPYYPSCA